MARSTCQSQYVQNTVASTHFWKLLCQKSASCRGAKHMSKVSMHKPHHARTTFGSLDVEKVYSQKLTWWGWGFRFCRHISGKHQNGFYKTKNIAFEQENFRPTKSKHPTPLLLGHRAPRAPTKSKSFKSTCYIQALKVWFKYALKNHPRNKLIL